MAFRYCDGIRRRDFLKAGALGYLGLNLPSYLQHAEAAAAQGKSADKSAILIYLSGGQTHMDTWDLKPDAPDGIRGEFKPIHTNVAGIDISEHLPRMAQNADKYAIIRSVTHNLAAHAPGSPPAIPSSPRTSPPASITPWTSTRTRSTTRRPTGRCISSGMGRSSSGCSHKPFAVSDAPGPSWAAAAA